VTRSPWYSRVLPNGALDAVVQIGMWFAAYYLYRLVRGVVDGQVATSFAHARGIVSFEHSLGLFFEPKLQHFGLDHLHWLVNVTNWCYVNMHLFGTTAFILWLYFVRNEAFYFVRNMFMVAMGIALIGYLVFPTAPPRFLPEWGFTDTVSSFVGDAAANTASVLYNPYAAIPSMHVAFALMLGFSGAKLVRRRPVKVLFYVYPLWVTLVTILTANHFWMDAVLGALTAAAAYWAASYALARARPHAWAWRRGLPAEAAA
jgi:membrane-associated phospholipid phosphatase